jgi:hypothetical protein
VIRLSSECSIDIDGNRKVWVTSSAEADDATDAGKLLDYTASAAALGAVSAYENAVTKRERDAMDEKTREKLATFSKPGGEA